MKLQDDFVSNKLEESIQNLLAKYQLEDVFFGLYCHVNKQVQKAKAQNNHDEQIQWEKLINILDEACELVEEGKNTSDQDNSYLIY